MEKMVPCRCGLFPTEKEAAAQIEELKMKAKDDIRDAFVKTDEIISPRISDG